MVLAGREDATEDVAGAVVYMVPKGKNSKMDSNFYALLSPLLCIFYAEYQRDAIFGVNAGIKGQPIRKLM